MTAKFNRFARKCRFLRDPGFTSPKGGSMGFDLQMSLSSAGATGPVGPVLTGPLFKSAPGWS